ncbi:MAG: hypothetical protein JNM06_03220 [Blastocatellia bacterium]|nr:hypothetical protein [Blastocatellia bacterium]MBN8724607.1 hypothetical protein [Acidobacteriota bacterium]
MSYTTRDKKDKKEKYVWVGIEILRIADVVTLRGSIRETDLSAILEGEFKKPFLEIKHLHWTTTVWDEITGQNKIDFVAHGRDGEWKWHTGTFFLKQEKILAIGLIEDCSKYLSLDEDLDDNNWTQ